eukprot:5477763-Karenia_brevis.AAC.1
MVASTSNSMRSLSAFPQGMQRSMLRTVEHPRLQHIGRHVISVALITPIMLPTSATHAVLFRLVAT